METIAILIVFLPLFSGIVNGLFCRSASKLQASVISSTALIITAICAAIIFYNISSKNIIIHILLSNWFNVGEVNLNWAIYVDALTSLMFVVVTFVSCVVHIYSLGYMSDDENLPKFLSFLSFFTFFMLALVSADNFMQLFFGWEGVGLCSYLLIGYWHHKNSANDAAMKAFLVNRVSDFAFVIGIVMVVLYTGKVAFADIFPYAELLAKNKIHCFFGECSILDIICFLLFIGCMGKSAQIGLHVWLPDAMEGPTPVSALIHAATMVTAGVFLLARCSYLFEYSGCVLNIIALIGGTTCLFAATIAITQSDIKKIIAYSTCSQLGYMFLACGVSAYNAAIFHLATHAFFKALLFLSAGSVIHAVHQQDIFKMGGLKSKLPITYTNFWAGSLAIIGIFPLAGFYSKDLILESAYGVNKIGDLVFILGIIAAILTAIYSMKIIILTFHGQTRLSHDEFEHAHESPIIMNLPLIILIGGTLFSGMIGYYLLNIEKPNGYFANSIFIKSHEEHHVESLIKILPLLVGIVGMVIGFYIYQSNRYKILAQRLSGLHKLLQNKYYFDEIYHCFIVKTIDTGSKVLNLFDQKVIDRFGPNGFARITYYFGWAVSHLQTGFIFNYTFYIILSLIICTTMFVINYIKMF